MRVSLPYPHKALWPNGRAHWATKHRETQKHKAWAWGEAMAAKSPTVGDGPIPVRLTVYPKKYGPLPDRDNCIAAMKAYQDGIAQALGIDDKHFAEPVLTFGTPRDGRFVIEVGL